MQLESHEYGIGVLPTKSGFTDAIIISKKALEEWRKHYMNVSNQDQKEKDVRLFYVGKADTLTDILKHFEDEENNQGRPVH